MSDRDFRLPDLGEGLPDGEIVRWLVAAGDAVEVNQPLVEVETAKALVEVPSPWAGTVAALRAEPGTTVAVGTPIVTISVAGADDVPPETTSAANGDGGSDRMPVLVGYGPASHGAPRRRHRARPAAASVPAPTPAPEPLPGPAAAATPSGSTPAARVAVLAKPPVRKLARDLGVDLATVAATGPAGTISREDVQRAAAARREPAERAEPAGRPGERRPDQRIPVAGVRRATAAAMVASAFTAPHVTEFLQVDATPTLELRDRLAGLPEFADVKVTPLLLVAKALLVAVRRHPMVNSSWDEPAGEIVVHGGVNLGIAVATPRGLVVPNIPGADRMTLPELAGALRDLAATAREGRTEPAAMRGGTITITNIGLFGVDIGTPILNPGESAILALGSIRPMPWVHEGELAVRHVAQLAMSFDHRVVDGELGSAVLSDVGRMIADPTLALAWS